MSEGVLLYFQERTRGLSSQITSRASDPNPQGVHEQKVLVAPGNHPVVSIVDLALQFERQSFRTQCGTHESKSQKSEGQRV